MTQLLDASSPRSDGPRFSRGTYVTRGIRIECHACGWPDVSGHRSVGDACEQRDCIEIQWVDDVQRRGMQPVFWAKAIAEAWGIPHETPVSERPGSWYLRRTVAVAGWLCELLLGASAVWPAIQGAQRTVAEIEARMPQLRGLIARIADDPVAQRMLLARPDTAERLVRGA